MKASEVLREHRREMFETLRHGGAEGSGAGRSPGRETRCRVFTADGRDVSPDPAARHHDDRAARGRNMIHQIQLGLWDRIRSE